MGTNYYVMDKPCETCGRSGEELHVGKSSAGWCFSLHVWPEKGLNTLGDWIAFWRDGKIIRDEYGEEVSEKEMLQTITERSGRGSGAGIPWPYTSWSEMYAKNDAEPGPDGLTRHKINRYCIGHGPGTWDLFDCDFS
jgi:hypothetical protein